MNRLGLLSIAWASARSRRLTLGLMVLTVALTTTLLVSTERLRHDLRASFSNALSGTDLIVAARADPVQVMLSVLFHLGRPSQNVSRARIEALAALPQVEWLVPIALGDSYRGLPVVATTRHYFERIRTGDSTPLAFKAGRAFDASKPAVLNEVVIGASVAQRFGLQVEGRITLAHGGGIIQDRSHEDHPFTVVGVLQPTGTPIDRTLLISLEAFQTLHAGWVGGAAPRSSRTESRTTGPSPIAKAPESGTVASALPRPPSYSAALIGLRTRSAVFSVQRQMERPHAEPLTAVLPGVALDQLWSLLGHGERILLLMITLVGLTALVGLVATTLTGLDARRRELAILRALGARPRTLFALVLIETSIVALIGIAAGVAISAALLSLAAGPLQMGLGLVLGTHGLTLDQAILLAAVFCTVLAAGVVPALRAARMSLADGLAPPH